MRFGSFLAIPSTCAALSALAQPPHLGTWEIDYAKSGGSEVVWRFLDLGDGLWEFQIGSRKAFHFRMDDEECASCTGFHQWEPIGTETYLTSFVGPIARDIVKISGDGNSLSFIQRVAAYGAVEERVGIFERLSGGPGLAGTWRSRLERSAFPPLVELSPGIGEWFVFEWASVAAGPGEDLVCVLLLDGEDHPCFSAMRSGWTIAMERVGPETLEVLIKENGDTEAEWVYAVSSDGESMTRMQRSVTGGSIEAVYNRRSSVADR